MVLQAYVDDSVSDGIVLVLAGYLAKPEKWSAFTEEWQQLLSVRPPWKRFKMSEIVMNGGDANRERIRYHYNAIRKHAQLGFAICISIKYLNAVFNTLKIPPKLDNPYVFGWHILIDTILGNLGKNGSYEPIEFIFDEQTESARILQSQQSLYRNFLRDHGPRLHGFPKFRSDNECLPLQAADMFAWIIRKKFLNLGTILGDQNYYFPWGQRMPILSTLCMEPGEDKLFEVASLMVGFRACSLDGTQPGWVEIPQSAFKTSLE